MIFVRLAADQAVGFLRELFLGGAGSKLNHATLRTERLPNDLGVEADIRTEVNRGNMLDCFSV